MTKDIGYVIKIERDNDLHDFWIWDESENGFVTSNPRSATLYYTPESAKEAAKKYFKSIGNEDPSIRVFIQEVKYKDIACWRQKDIELLLKED